MDEEGTVIVGGEVGVIGSAPPWGVGSTDREVGIDGVIDDRRGSDGAIDEVGEVLGIGLAPWTA